MRRKRRTKKSKQYDVLALLWVAGIAITFFVASALQSWGKFSLLYESDKLHFALSIGVALMTFSLFVGYAVATHHELSLLRDYIGESEAPRIMPKTYIAVVLLALVFGLLVTISDKILCQSTRSRGSERRRDDSPFLFRQSDPPSNCDDDVFQLGCRMFRPSVSLYRPARVSKRRLLHRAHDDHRRRDRHTVVASTIDLQARLIEGFDTSNSRVEPHKVRAGCDATSQGSRARFSRDG